VTTKCFAVLFNILHVYVLAPVVFMLLPNKKRKTYYRAFKGLKGALKDLGLPDVLLAKWVMSDFESNIKTQFLRVFPGIPWRHCLFHYVKAVLRQVIFEINFMFHLDTIIIM